MDKSLVKVLKQTVNGKEVKECSVCHEAKELNKFFKDKFSGFRYYKEVDDETKVSDVCRACRLREARTKKEAHLKEIGWKPSPKNLHA